MQSLNLKFGAVKVTAPNLFLALGLNPIVEAYGGLFLYWAPKSKV
jgi:hypothetical protein